MTDPGRFIAVIGPSGVGKDSVMRALAAKQPDLHMVRRVITRDPEAGGEEFHSVDPARFLAQADRGAFALHWKAHDLHYGIPARVRDILASGQDVIANLSRAVLAQARVQFPTLHILSITASPAVLKQRLEARGRESTSQIARRLSRPSPDVPTGLRITQIDNSGALETSVNAAMRALYPDKA